MHKNTTWLGVLGAALALSISPRLVAQQPAAPAAPAAAGVTKLAVVDIQRAVMETEDGLRAQAQLKKYFDRRQAELNGRQEELLKKKDDLEKQSKLLSKEALARAMEDWQRQMAELQQVFQSYNGELGKKQNEITAPIFARVSGYLRKIAKKDGYDVILDRQAVPYVKAELDLTDLVISMYNSGEDTPAEAAPATSGSAAPAASGAKK
ncbi:MAG: OmpH family outer membrane protein [Polyangiaceae bacterium]|nr:OmpH family outer membrane protein [Polyangiaceae bacterium]